MLLEVLMTLGDCGQDVSQAMAADFHQQERHYHRGHGDGHGRSYDAVRELIFRSGFSDGARACALKIYEYIAAAEAEVHGENLDTIHFHEVGRDEAIKNALGIGMALEAIRPDRILVSDIVDGKGSILCSHGEIPVPVPAVMALRAKSSFNFRQVDVNTEMVTPSGLAGLMGIGAEPAGPGVPAGNVVKKAEAAGRRKTGRGGLKACIIEAREK